MELVLEAIAEAIEFMLHSGGGELLREWVLPVHSGRFTLPRDLATPVKYKILNTASGGFGIFQSPYLSYSSAGVKTCIGYADWQFEVKSRKVATQFRLPPRGLHLVLTTKNKKDVGKKASIAGKKDGMLIAPIHRGKPTAGEILTIYLEDDPNKKFSSFLFHEVTNVVKDITCDYVMLSGLEDGSNVPYFLSHFHPDEEVPTYTEVELYQCPTFSYPSQCDTWIHVLGRINPSIVYQREEDVLPISSFQMLKLLAKRAKYDSQNEFKNVGIMEARIFQIIKKERKYQQAPGRTLSFNLAAGSGSLTNL